MMVTPLYVWLQPSWVTNKVLEAMVPPASYEDFSHADVIMLIGANIADNHPILKLHIAKNKSITGKEPTIIVIDPRFSKTANMADIFVPLKPRTDLALINGLCYIIFEQGWEDEKFIKERTTGHTAFKKHIMAAYPPQEVANITGIDVKDLYRIAKVYATADKSHVGVDYGRKPKHHGNGHRLCHL